MKNNKRAVGSLCLIIAGLSYGFAQNSVTNPTLDAPKIANGYAEIIKTESWTNANGGTVDLFDRKKATKKHAANGIPNNYMGYQNSQAPDQNYAGIIAFYDDGSNNKTDSDINTTFKLKDGYKQYSEYLQGELTAPLEAGKAYQVSFKINLADKSGRAVSCMGVLLSPDKLEQKSNAFLKQTPQFISHRVITDSVNWISMYGTFIATGGEKFITIGCFKDEYFQVQKTVTPLQNDSRKAYYYISGVSVAPYVSKPELDAIVSGVDYIEVMDLRFENESFVIAPKYYNELDEIASYMSAHPDMTFFVAGYTDKTGDNGINNPLSINRANEVKKYLVTKGVKESNIITEGFGSSNPIESKVKSRKNRRVEIYLYSINKNNTSN